MFALAVAVALSLSSQAPPSDPADVPDLHAPSSPGVTAPNAPAAPAPTAPTPALPPRTTTTPSTTTPSTEHVEPLDPWLVGVLQGGMFCLSLGLGIPCALSTAPGGLCLLCFVPFAAGYTATFIGDHFGPERAPSIGPIVASYASACGAVTLGLVVFAALIGFNGANANPNVAVYTSLASGAAVLAAGSVAVPIVYSVTATNKAPGDDGSAFPGWFSASQPAKPATPAATPSSTSPRSSLSSGFARVMRY